MADCEILKIAKEWRKWEATVDELQNNLISIPDIIAQIEIAHTQISKYEKRRQKDTYLSLTNCIV